MYKSFNKAGEMNVWNVMYNLIGHIRDFNSTRRVEHSITGNVLNIWSG